MPTEPQSRWTYAEIEVADAERQLRPTHVCGTSLRFNEPPHLTSEVIAITVRNGERSTTRQARVLAHHPDALHIPIELIVADEASSTAVRRTA